MLVNLRVFAIERGGAVSVWGGGYFGEVSGAGGTVVIYCTVYISIM